ncbi:MAG: adenosine kinase, partial [Proteobacteria bacterium]|nr:adenosine kinase [Pseudomonadota bacterium]
MAEAHLDVVTIGNAIVDILSHADGDFLIKHDLPKGSMNLVDAERSARLYDAMGPGVEMSGGSAANTAVGVASLGGSGAFIGKVHADALGEVFAHDIRAAGIDFETPQSLDGPPTARCLVFVAPDAQRTMATYLGACVELGPDDIAPDVVAGAQVTYLEGYLWDPPRAKEAFRRAIKVAHEAGRKTALTLSDSFCVDRYREEFLALLDHDIDILFANEDELKSLYQVDDFDEALQRVRGHCEIAALTRGVLGSVVLRGDEVHVVDAEVPDKLIDTTGAGDLYAAGFLFGLTHGHDL